MLSFADWFPLAMVGGTFTALGLVKLYGLRQGIEGGQDKPLARAPVWHLTVLEEPQSAAGDAVVVPRHRAGGIGLAGLGCV